MESDYEFDDIPDEDWMSLNQEGEGTSTYNVNQNGSVPNSGPVSAGVQATSSSAKGQQQPLGNGVFQRPPFPISGVNGPKNVRTAPSCVL